MKTYQNYIFDLYGTLVDIHTNEEKMSLWKNLAQIFSMMGAFYTAGELRRQYKKLVKEEMIQAQQRAWETFGNVKITREETEILLESVFKRLLSDKGVEADAAEIRQAGFAFRSLSMGYIKLFDGVPELLMRLRGAGKKVYLLSNAQRMFTEPEMKMLGIYELFHGILYSSDVGVKKPSPYFYEVLFQRYDLKKAESVMIGNEYRADICGAESYGIDSMYLFTARSGENPPVLLPGCRRIGQIGEVYY